MFVITKKRKQKEITAQKLIHQISTIIARKVSIVKNIFYNITIKTCSMKKSPTATTTTTTGTRTVKNVNCLAKTTTIYMQNNYEGSSEKKHDSDNKNIIKKNISSVKSKYTNSICMLNAIWLILTLFVSVIVPKTNALMNTKIITTTLATPTTTTIILALERYKLNSDDECVNKNISNCKETSTTTTTTTMKTTTIISTTQIKTNDNNNNNNLSSEFAISTLPSKVNIILQMDKRNKSNSDNESDNDNLIDVDDEAASEYIYDRTDVRIIFITLYTLVFCCCFFGNLLVILVVTMSRRLRSITNFFLANLALADFCVGLFCVMQNLSIYLIDSWVFGEFLCRMYQFVHSLSYTASIFILVVICMERYFAIVHPITCKQILTAARLRMVILTVWITSALYSTPKFIFSKTIKNIHTRDGQEEDICVLDRKMFNSKMLDMINFGLLYVIPLLVMMVLYSKIAIALWRSSHGLSHHLAQQQQHQHQHQNQRQQQQQQQQHNHQENGMNLHNSMYHHHHHNPHGNHYKFGHTHSFHQNNSIQQLQQQQLREQEAKNGVRMTTTVAATSAADVGIVSSGSVLLTRKQSSKYEKRNVSISESQVSLDSDRPTVSACRKKSFYNHSHQNDNHYHNYTHYQRGVGTTALGSNNGSGSTHSSRIGGVAAHTSHSSSNNVLRARRGVVRMLIIFVLTFALCNLPYHARKMWQYWSRSYRGDSNFIALLTPLTFLVSYFNSGVNPLLYAFLSRNFRKGMKELLLCSWKKAKGKSSSNAAIHQKRSALQTHSLPTDTTHIGNEQL